jgi:Na+-exporting ATPase
MPPKTQPQRMERHPFLLSAEEVAQQLETNLENGLKNLKVQELQNKYSPNELQGGGGIAWYKILMKQISNAMILVRHSQFLFLAPLTFI